MTSLFLHFLKRDSRSSHTWIIRTILSALILLPAGLALAVPFEHAVHRPSATRAASVGC